MLGNLRDITGKGLRRIGIVSNPNLFSSAIGNFQILDALVSICPQGKNESIREKVRPLIDEGFEAIIDCRDAYQTARDLNVEADFAPVSQRQRGFQAGLRLAVEGNESGIPLLAELGARLGHRLLRW